MKTETIEYKDGDVTLRGYLAYDEKKSGKRPRRSRDAGGFRPG